MASDEDSPLLTPPRLSGARGRVSQQIIEYSESDELPPVEARGQQHQLDSDDDFVAQHGLEDSDVDVAAPAAAGPSARTKRPRHNGPVKEVSAKRQRRAAARPCDSGSSQGHRTPEVEQNDGPVRRPRSLRKKQQGLSEVEKALQTMQQERASGQRRAASPDPSEENAPVALAANRIPAAELQDKALAILTFEVDRKTVSTALLLWCVVAPHSGGRVALWVRRL